MHVTDSLFKHNVAREFGGAIAQGDEGDVIILRSTFIKNAANNDSDQVGGGALAIFGGGKQFSITDSRFSYNRAIANGGAI